MHIFLWFPLSAVAAFSSTSASADNLCISYVEQTLSPRTFEQVLRNLPPVVIPKGEFESTTAFETRIRDASALSGGDIILHRPVDEQTFPDPLAYDADKQVFEVRSGAFDWGTTNWSKAFSLGASGSTGYFDVATVISRNDKTVGYYNASNALGVSAQISKIVRSTDSVWVRKENRSGDKMFNADKQDVVGNFPLSPAEAQASKPFLKFALVIKPKPPFLVSDSGPILAPTLADLRSINEKRRILIADVKCGLVLNSSNKVLAAFAAN